MENPISKGMSGEEFVQLLTEKANIIKNHLKKRQSQLVICANVGPNMATFKLFNKYEEVPLKLHVTLSNMGDIDEQLDQLWMQVNFVLRQHCTHCQRFHASEHH